MDVNCINEARKKIKAFLVFFYFMLLIACQNGEYVRNLQLDYDGGKAVGITFDSDMDVEKLRIFRGEESEISVIGVIVSIKDRHTFTPAIPFTAGQTYSIRKGDTMNLATFTVRQIYNESDPELLAIYPTQDSVPENLLKMYLQFSRPMQEAWSALDFISVYNHTDSVYIDPFLKLETELWNKEHTLLTLWFDPGRIKTDLIPNQNQGLPLSVGKQYTVSIDKDWIAANGRPLGKAYSKKLIVHERDAKKPALDDWKIVQSDDGLEKSLIIDFGEPMDAFLSQETIAVYDTNGLEIKGTFQLGNEESTLKFIPTKQWTTGVYELRVQSRLEDLAGNNLNRLFDTDLGEKEQGNHSKINTSVRFNIE